MTDLICRKSMMRCQTPGMCSPHGGCQDPVTQQLRAENKWLRNQIPSTEMVWCACGDGYPVNSYGAGFMDANNGVCANCDAANGGVEPGLDTPDELKALRKDAERYRWFRNQHWDGSAICAVVDPKQSTKLGAYCPSEKLLDEAIDAALTMSKEASHG
ncbi:hypothetical protein [Pseudomonas typographi]|uniref:Uncharacterized protein n=1 Tax=Pseudomonas typographi TaxID=2715964 RepID=A0ABR7ZA69_9PSED|nr:hypothetical protein [Pseudomonas typographi]MBD1602354.1 hypothetical protein [Pseudomonas typographi]